MRLTIDLHGMGVAEAKRTLERFLNEAPADCREIVVVHGHTKGDALKGLLEDPNGIRHRRIVRRKFTKNPGETVLVLDV